MGAGLNKDIQAFDEWAAEQSIAQYYDVASDGFEAGDGVGDQQREHGGSAAAPGHGVSLG